VGDQSITSSKKNRFSTRFTCTDGFPSWLGFLSYLFAFLGPYLAAKTVGHALGSKQPTGDIA